MCETERDTGCHRGCWIPLLSSPNIVRSQLPWKFNASVQPGLTFSPLSSLGHHQHCYRPKLRPLIFWSIEQWVAVLRESIDCYKESHCVPKIEHAHVHTVKRCLCDTVHILQPPHPHVAYLLVGCQGSHSLCHSSPMVNLRVHQLELSSLWVLYTADVDKVESLLPGTGGTGISILNGWTHLQIGQTNNRTSYESYA